MNKNPKETTYVYHLTIDEMNKNSTNQQTTPKVGITTDTTLEQTHTLTLALAAHIKDKYEDNTIMSCTACFILEDEDSSATNMKITRVH